MTAAERIFKLLDEPLAISETSQGLPVAALAADRECSAAISNSATSGSPITAAPIPKDEDWVLRDVSFHLRPGQTIAIVGHTGAGKTTIIQLLLRFYEIQRGQILLDGVDLRQLDAHALRRQLGIVLQDPFLFTGTLESNVRLGTERIDRAAVERALHRSRPRPLPRHASAGTRYARQRTRRHLLRRTAPAHQLRPRPGPRSAPAHSRRSHLQRGHHHRNAHPPAPSIACSPAAPPSSSPIASAPSSTPTASWSSTRAACANRAPTASSWPSAASTTASTSSNIRTRNSPSAPPQSQAPARRIHHRRAPIRLRRLSRRRFV